MATAGKDFPQLGRRSPVCGAHSARVCQNHVEPHQRQSWNIASVAVHLVAAVLAPFARNRQASFPVGCVTLPVLKVTRHQKNARHTARKRKKQENKNENGKRNRKRHSQNRMGCLSAASCSLFGGARKRTSYSTPCGRQQFRSNTPQLSHVPIRKARALAVYDRH